MKLEPQVNFASLDDEFIAALGLAAAGRTFRADVEAGLTIGDSLVIVVGCIESNGQWQQLGQRGFGPDAAQFRGNIDPQTGKLATVLQWNMDSVQAYYEQGENIPEGPPRFTGGVHYVARVQTATRGWLTRVFAGAASGVQGHFDQAAVYAALVRMGALWALKMQALHGKP